MYIMKKNSECDLYGDPKLQSTVNRTGNKSNRMSIF